MSRHPHRQRFEDRATPPGPPLSAYSVALNSTGRSLEAVTVLEEALARAPLVRNLLLAIATIRRDRGERGAALRHAGTLVRYRPDDAGVRQLYAELAGTSPRQ